MLASLGVSSIRAAVELRKEYVTLCRADTLKHDLVSLSAVNVDSTDMSIQCIKENKSAPSDITERSTLGVEYLTMFSSKAMFVEGQGR